MTETRDHGLLDALLESWNRNSAILTNLLRAIPEGDLGARAVEGGPTVAQLFNHAHFVRLVFISENAPDFPVEVPEVEWADDHDVERVAQKLNESAKAVRDVVKSRLDQGREMALHYDHPILFMQMMIWHEGYHHGQIKLALKLSGRPLSDRKAGPVTWGVWMRKTKAR